MFAYHDPSDRITTASGHRWTYTAVSCSEPGSAHPVPHHHPPSRRPVRRVSGYLPDDDAEVIFMDPTNDESAARTSAAWRAAGESGDVEAACRCLATGIEVISPLTAQFRFRGHADAHDMLTAAFEVISDIRYHTDIGDEATRALFFHGRCGSEQFEEAQLLRFGLDGLITELTLFGRPLPGVTAVMAAIGPALLRRQGRPGMAKVVGTATKPLAAMTRLGEAHLAPLAKPAER